MRICPTCAVPVTRGATTFAGGGGSATCAVWPERTDDVPPIVVAVTLTWIVAPASARTGWYVALIAFGIAPQPLLVQRCHS